MTSGARWHSTGAAPPRRLAPGRRHGESVRAAAVGAPFKNSLRRARCRRRSQGSFAGTLRIVTIVLVATTSAAQRPVPVVPAVRSTWAPAGMREGVPDGPGGKCLQVVSRGASASLRLLCRSGRCELTSRRGSFAIPLDRFVPDAAEQSAAAGEGHASNRPRCGPRPFPVEPCVP